MKKMLLIPLSCLVLFSCDSVGNLFSQNGNQNQNNDNPASWPKQTVGDAQKLKIPPLIDSRDESLAVSLTMQQGSVEFFSGTPSSTYGFNGDFLGPAIRLYKGDTVSMSIANQIGEVTTVHGHGLHVPGNIDGGPQLKIQPGETWNFDLPVQQEASTSWYHPHLMGKTAEHVFKGLAGLYLIEDDNSQALSLPKEYGVDDIPLVIQDRLFSNGDMEYRMVSGMDDGYLGNVVMVNGTVNPYLDVPAGLVRLRLLNGSNARFYLFSFSDGRSFSKIATDGGFLNSPQNISSLVMAPGERYEIVVDFSDGAEVNLITSRTYNNENNDPLFNNTGSNQVKVLEIRPNTLKTAPGSLPNTLNNIDYYTPTDDVKIRTFVLNMNGDGDSQDSGNDDGAGDDGNFDSQWRHTAHSGSLGGSMTMGINGRPMDMNYINERVTAGRLELWRISTDEMTHPFHVHGTSFQVIRRNGQPVPDSDRGWKDTVIVDDNGYVEFLVRFDYEATEEFPYMYHCHILEHEDMGMMGQFTVTR